MTLVRRLLSLFQDSPTFERDRAGIVSSFTIGITALLLNAAVMFFVFPLLLETNDTDFRMLTENIEFGQLLGLILPGGATLFATVLIPFRLANVLMAPRIGRYFDQIVLSGISPFRFLIGKVLSQNLFFALIAALLIPWFVLVLSLGGLEWPVFLGNLLLVWLYCMMLSLVSLWLSLYVNELGAAFPLIYFGLLVCGLGCIPISPQPFIVTPFPALMHSVYSAVEIDTITSGLSYFSTFLSCAVGMCCLSAIAFVQIYLGPVYGIIRDNSTFGEVVKAGDSRRKGKLKFRLHIQRPSELAFFYENRGRAFRSWEGLLRWSLCVMSILVPACVSWLILNSVYVRTFSVMAPAMMQEPQMSYWRLTECYVMIHLVHGIALVLAVMLFSHPRNSTLLKLPVIAGRRLSIGMLDALGFALVMLLSTAVSLALPRLIDEQVRSATGVSLLQNVIEARQGHSLALTELSLAGTMSLTLSALAMYSIQRLFCTLLWLKSVAFVWTFAVYFGLFCLTPLMTAGIIHEFDRFNDLGAIADLARAFALVSPITVLVESYGGFGEWFTNGMSFAPFAIVNGLLIAICVRLILRRTRALRADYPAEQGQSAVRPA